MPRLNCNVCDDEFYAKPSHISKGWGKYCSKSCQYSAQKVGRVFECFICKKEVYRNIKDQKKSKTGNFFCSKSCQTKWRNTSLYSGENHKNWKNGESSYRARLLRSSIPQICSKCSTGDSRVLAVHHKDKNRDNNELSNLLWLCHNCHYLVHHFRNEAKDLLVPVA